uniref:NADH-ubiquinone oxidoreductase chain 2 n=1 Tax=Bragasellus molinai TaxID=1281925 RepID=A0A485MEE4_9CRUS|nr:NADH dehydrogenase subunit 2 [Bragasellus molinai]
MNFLFLITLFFGITLMILSKSWFSAWLGLEINLMSFIPLIMLSQSQSKEEASLKYFLIQAVASLIILQISFVWIALSPYLCLILALSMKLGLAPLHFWLPYLTEKISWMMNIILLTLQKIGPLFLLSSTTMFNSKILLFMSAISACVGAVGGLNEMFLRKLMAYSSINHMGWMVAAMMMSTYIWVLYLFTYIFISSTLMLVMEKYKIFHLNQMIFKSLKSLHMAIMFLSLGGFPPLLGFAPKWAVIFTGLDKFLILVFILIVASTVTLYYYIRSGLIILILNSSKVLMSAKKLQNQFMNFYFNMNIYGGILFMFLWSFTP